MTIEAESDAIQSIASLYVEEGNYTLTSGGGAPETISSTNDQPMGQVGGPLNIEIIVTQLIEANDLDDDVKEQLLVAESIDEIRTILEENGESLTTMPGDRGERPEGMTPPGGMEGENGQMAPPDGMQGENGQMTPPNEMEDDTTDDETMDETSDDTPSTKGLKAENTLVIASGTFTINSLDDAIHSNNEIQIDGGTVVLSSGDDGIHADNVLTINAGELTVEKSYEGIEANIVTIHDGSLNITSTDDGMNAGTGASNGETGYLAIHGGDITIDASGDGIDSNTTVDMTGGTVIVNGPVDGGNGALDYDETFTISGGTLIAAGSSAMAQGPSDTSSQPSIVYQFDQSTTEAIALTDDSGQFILGFTPTKSYQTIVVSSPLLQTDTTFTWHTAVEVDGEAVNGLITEGVITTSTELDFTLTDTLTYLTPSGVSSTPLTESGFGGRPNRPAK
ncbi:carbohydrate-binding domain-containing protein [Halolactibacillus sp. JCM 19043]